MAGVWWSPKLLVASSAEDVEAADEPQLFLLPLVLSLVLTNDDDGFSRFFIELVRLLKRSNTSLLGCCCWCCGCSPLTRVLVVVVL